MRKRKKSSPRSVDTRWFQLRLKDLGLSQRRFAFTIGYDPATVSFVFRGKKAPTLEMAMAISKAMETPYDEVLKRLGIDVGASPKDTASIPVSGWLDSTLSLQPSNGLKGPKHTANPFGDRDLKAVRCQTAGSPFDALDGALVFYRQTRGQGLDPELVGHLAMVGTDIEGARLKLRLIRPGYTRGRFHLAAPNGQVIEEDAQIAVAYAVVWMKF